VQVDREQIYRAIICLVNAAMSRLVKGAELSVADSSDLYAKGGDSTGDLGSGASRKASTVLLGRGREMMFSVNSPALVEEDETGDIDKMGEVKKPKERVHELLYSQVTTLNFKTIVEMESQLKNLEFKNVFRLPVYETITDQESPCYLYISNPSSSTPCGTLFFGVEFLCFGSTLSSKDVALNLPLLSTILPLLSRSPTPPSHPSDSLIFSDSGQVAVNFVLPYSHITSISTHAATALVRINPSMSGYILVKTRGGASHYLSFSSMRTRDRVAGEIMERIRNSRFGDSVIIGGRNGNEVVPKEREVGSDIGVGEVGLRLLFNDDGLFERNESVGMWEEYFKIHGGDVCMIKDMKRLREMVLKSNGVFIVFD
jgi:hypothetical protein